jgi:hypothetical protein
MMRFADISLVRWLRIYNNVVLHCLSVDSSYATYSLCPASIQYQSTTERLLITQNNKNTTPLSMLAQAVTRYIYIFAVLGSNHVRRTNYPEWSFRGFTQPLQTNSKLLSSIIPVRLPSQFSIHCHLFSRRYTTASERARNVKINKAGNGHVELASNHCGCGKSISIKYSEFVPVFPASVIRHEKRMRRIMSSVTCLALTRVSTLPYIRRHFRNTFIENKNV